MKHDIYQQRVKDFMSKDVVTVDAIDTAHEALVLMVENRVGAVPVLNGRSQCIGVVSATDLIGLAEELDGQLHDLGDIEDLPHGWLVERLSENDWGRRRVDELMTETVASVSPEASLVDAARHMLCDRVHRLPVVDREGRLLGIISTTDVMSAFVEAAPQVTA